MHTFANYLELTKPGIIVGNLLTVAAGFFVAAHGRPDTILLTMTLGAAAMVMASGCVFNNVIDRDIDAKMERTKNRALARGAIRPAHAIIFAGLLGIAGIFIFALRINLTAAGAAIFGLFAYAVLYSMWWKRRSVYGTEIGSIAGAMPPVIGYVAAVSTVDLGALLLFLTLVAWQMPHFYAIGIRRLGDYRNAGVPILPVVAGVYKTKLRMLVWVVLFTAAAASLSLYGYTNEHGATTAVILGCGWLAVVLLSFSAHDEERAAKGIFLTSIAVLTLMSLSLILNSA